MTARAKRCTTCATAVLVAVAAALPASNAGAATPSPPSSSAPASGDPAPMSLSFTRHTVRLVGPGARVFVACAGDVAGNCEGTLRLQLASGPREAAFSIAAGGRQTLTVPLGRSAGALASAAPETVEAVAETLQPLGLPVLTAESLHLR
jgi:hypothetical protein